MLKAFGRWLGKPLRCLLIALGFLCKVVIATWATLAIYYSNLPWPGARLALSLAFAAFSIWALWLARNRRAFLVFAALFLCVLGWFLSLRPTHDRPWRPDVAVLPRAYIDGDRVRITGIRDFDYHSPHDFTIRYQERDVWISHLTSIDFFVAYFMPPLVAHTFLSFNFDNAPPLCISIEKRIDKGRRFDAVASLFRQFEVIYVVGEERDIVRLRTNFRHEDVYIYHIRTTPERARRLFGIYLQRINELYARPEFYHLLSNSCTVNIVRYARIVGKPWRLDIRHLVNGFIDSYLYSMGLIDTDLPFEELRPRSRINDAAQAADNAPDFSERIRAAIPPRQPAAGYRDAAEDRGGSGGTTGSFGGRAEQVSEAAARTAGGSATAKSEQLSKEQLAGTEGQAAARAAALKRTTVTAFGVILLMATVSGRGGASVKSSAFLLAVWS